VIWVGDYPGSNLPPPTPPTKSPRTSSNFLEKNGVKDVEVEWHEAVSWKAAGPALQSSSHQVANLGTDSGPDAVETGAVDSTKRLGRLVGVSASGPDPGIFG
jgi:hypothetical protein